MQHRELVKPVLNPAPNITRITTAAGLHTLENFFIRCNGVVGWDIETTPVKDFYWRKIRTMQFGNTNEQYVIDLRAFCDDNPDTLFNALGQYGANLTPGLQLVVDTIKPIICSNKFLKVGVNLPFEYGCHYWQLGLRTFNFYDCSLAEKTIFAGSQVECPVSGRFNMKNYAFCSMESMMARYFGFQIDKDLQESFTLECDLTPEQDLYATLDTRFPMAIRAVQSMILKGQTYKQLKASGSKNAAFLEFIDPVVTGDNLEEIVRIECAAIGAFEDMHIHGECLDTEKWNARVAKAEGELKTLISDVLDPIFIPVVGTKSQVITDQDIADAEAKWKAYNVVSDAELALKKQASLARKNEGDESEAWILNQLHDLEQVRKAAKEPLKKAHGELKKRRTAIKKLIEKCEGEALINYGSDAQLLKVVKEMKGLGRVTSLDDETLEKYEGKSVMDAIRKYHGLKKEVGTYGYAWTTKWTTKPCKDEGWLHPGDGRLHCVFNQYDAETGRSSSEKPNGQNLPQDKEVRACFRADPPNEEIRISDCCNAETEQKMGGIICSECRTLCSTHAEDYSLITIDMSGAELRILAEEAQDPVWIGAFNRGEDVHSVCTGMVEPVKWPLLALPSCLFFQKHTEVTVAPIAQYGAKVGDPMRLKCKCPEHNEMRNGMKPTNFGLPYGIGPRKLAAQIKKSEEDTIKLLNSHKSAFPAIWTYLEQSGLKAKIQMKSFDMFGRRRLFPPPTWETAKKQFIEYKGDKLLLPEEEADHNIEVFETVKGRKPNAEELWTLTHREPTNGEISKSLVGMSGSIERQGKNHRIQSGNATIIKLAMGSGKCKAGIEFLWHIFPKYAAKLIKMVHDELVVQVPTRLAQTVAGLIQDAMARAAAEKMKLVRMESEFHVGPVWCK